MLPLCTRIIYSEIYKYSNLNSRQLLLLLFMVEWSVLATEWKTCEEYEMCCFSMFQSVTAGIISDYTEMEGSTPHEVLCCITVEMCISIVLTVTQSC
jgi:hypothetical protein